MKKKNLSGPVGVFFSGLPAPVWPTNNVVPTIEHWPGFGMSGHNGRKKGAGIRADGLDGLLRLFVVFFHLTLTSKGLLQRPTHESVIPTKVNTTKQISFPYIPPRSWKLALYAHLICMNLVPLFLCQIDHSTRALAFLHLVWWFSRGYLPGDLGEAPIDGTRVALGMGGVNLHSLKNYPQVT